MAVPPPLRLAAAVRRLLDAHRGGRFLVAPEGLVAARQHYLDDTAVLVTELRTRDAVVRVTDAFVLRSEAHLSGTDEPAPGALLRHVAVLGGPVRLRVEVDPLDGLRCALDFDDGDQTVLLLGWGDGRTRPDADLLDDTVDAWRRWTAGLHYVGPHAGQVRRSAITLKLLDYVPGGAIVAAPTSSLPEAVGRQRNWDYRYTWIRDAAFGVYALRRIGRERQAESFLRWVLDTVGDHERPLVVYDIDGRAGDG